VKPREEREGEHAHGDHKPTDSTETEAEPQKYQTSCECDDAAPHLDTKRKRWHTNDELHVKRRQENGKNAADRDLTDTFALSNSFNEIRLRP
jgi:hypothetical protein